MAIVFKGATNNELIVIAVDLFNSRSESLFTNYITHFLEGSVGEVHVRVSRELRGGGCGHGVISKFNAAACAAINLFAMLTV